MPSVASSRQQLIEEAFGMFSISFWRVLRLSNGPRTCCFRTLNHGGLTLRCANAKCKIKDFHEVCVGVGVEGASEEQVKECIKG